jgi:hypothetical protein
MQDPLAHTRPLFHKVRVVAGPEHFFALSSENLFAGPIRSTLGEAEADADVIHEEAKLGRWLACGGVAFSNRGLHD